MIDDEFSALSSITIKDNDNTGEITFSWDHGENIYITMGQEKLTAKRSSMLKTILFILDSKEGSV